MVTYSDGCGVARRVAGAQRAGSRSGSYQVSGGPGSRSGSFQRGGMISPVGGGGAPGWRKGGSIGPGTQAGTFSGLDSIADDHDDKPTPPVPVRAFRPDFKRPMEGVTPSSPSKRDAAADLPFGAPKASYMADLEARRAQRQARRTKTLESRYGDGGAASPSLCVSEESRRDLGV